MLVKLPFVHTTFFLLVNYLPFDFATRKINKNRSEKHDSKRNAKPQTTTLQLYPRPYYVTTNNLISAWRARFAECATMIAIFAFAG